jgi:serine/threonine protein kinase
LGDVRSDRAVVSTDLVGQRIMDRYAIVDRVARGGMSVVYRGEDERLRRPVCVKVFCGLDPSRPGYRTVHEHFVQEAFALSALRHPNTIRIFDFGYLEDELATPFFVVELADGGTLKEFVRKHGPLSPHETLEILEPIAGALREAHAAGIIHRDIKPSNILFSRVGPALVVKLADFSIAKALEDAFPNRADDTLNSADKVGLYSLGWAAPEQLRGDPVGPSADVFAIALTAAYMLSCKMVYPGDDVLQLFEMRRLGDAYLQKALGEAGLDDELLRVLSYACKSDATERLQTIEQFLEALREGVHGEWRNVTTRQERYVPAGSRAPSPPTDTSAEPEASVATFAHPGSSGVAPAFTPGVHAVSPASASSPSLQVGASAPPVLTVESLRTGDLVVGGRRVRPVEIRDELVLGAEAGIVASAARFRQLGAHLNIKGLNCFVVRDGSRASSGVDIERDTEVTLIAPSREPLDRVLVHLGTFDGWSRRFALQGAALAVPTGLASWSALLDLGPGREAILLFRPPGEHA